MRIDVYLTQKGFCESRNKASKLIDEGLVCIDGKRILKPSEDMDESMPHKIEISAHDSFVGRGALKLLHAIEKFSPEIREKKFIDVGASKGGFTEVLLMHGAMHVTAVDSGRGQLHPSLAFDSRVTNVEGYNARKLNPEDFGVFDGAVMDVSFISQTLIIPALSEIISEDGFLISLIKPQFEAGRSAVGKNGIVKNSRDREASVYKVVECASAFGLYVCDVEKSPIEGGDGNIEYLGYFRKNSAYKDNFEQIKTKINRLCRE